LIDTQSMTSPAATESDGTPSASEQLQERRRIIEEIRVLNPTAGHAFLAGFGTQALADYLEHLRHIRLKHVRLPGWVQRRCAALTEAGRQLQLRRVA
jgi:hypothetical protein